MEVTIEGAALGLGDYARRVAALVSHIEGTVPGSRGFGMPVDPVDMPLPDAEAEYGMALDEKVAEWVPEVEVDELEIRGGAGGAATARIAIAPLGGEAEP